MSATTTRTDIHRPSLLDPAEYSYLGCFYQGSSRAMEISYARDMDDLSRAIIASGAWTFEGNYQTKGTCDHCGAMFAHGACFLHIPTGQYISVGHICANDTIGLPSHAAAAKRRAEKAVAAEKAQQNRIAEMQGWRDENTDVVEFLATVEQAEVDYRQANEDGTQTKAPHPFLLEMVHSLKRWGSLFPKQAEAVRKFAARAAEFAARDAERQANPEPVPTTPLQTGRLILTGTILTTKVQDSDYGSTLKMLVKLDDHNKVWGTVPRSLEDATLSTSYYDADGGWQETPAQIEALRGQRVQFTATVKASDTDQHFGFFSRPTGAMLVGQVPPVEEVGR